MAGPDGQWLLEPQMLEAGSSKKDQLICVDLDLDSVRRERLAIDPSGHYARRDVFKLEVLGVEIDK